VTLSPGVFTVSGATGSPAPSGSIQVAITNPPDEFFYGAWSDGIAVSEADADLSTARQGNIRLTFWSPNQLGAGTYNDMVHFVICRDSRCDDLVVKKSVPVVYTVTGNPLPTTNFHVVPASPSQFEAISTDTAEKTVKLNITAFDIPPQGVYVRFAEEPAEGSPNLVTSHEFEQSGYISSNGTGAASYNITLAAPVALQPGRYQSEMVVRLCFDAACAMPVPSARNSLTVSYMVYASEGREFTSRWLDLDATYAAWDPFSEKLYVVRVFPTGDSAVTAVDPVTGTTGLSVSLPGEARTIALSDDGQFAYVTSVYPAVVHRIRLSDLQVDGVITLDPMRQARHVAVAPGSPQTIAVSQMMPAPEASIAIYDGLVKRGQEATTGASMAWNSTGTEIYSVGTSSTPLFRWSLTPGGLELAETITAPGGAGTAWQMFMESDLLYFGSGRRFDPVQGAFDSWLDLPCCNYLVARDVLQGRAFSAGSGLRSHSLATGKEIATAWIPGLTGGRYWPPPIRWGRDGLALLTYDGELVLINGTFVAP